VKRKLALFNDKELAREIMSAATVAAAKAGPFKEFRVGPRFRHPEIVTFDNDNGEAPR
jgi:hypothetical protein